MCFKIDTTKTVAPKNTTVWKVVEQRVGQPHVIRPIMFKDKRRRYKIGRVANRSQGDTFDESYFGSTTARNGIYTYRTKRKALAEKRRETAIKGWRVAVLECQVEPADWLHSSATGVATYGKIIPIRVIRK